MASHKDELPPINFEALAAALLSRALELVSDWLPGGVRRGDEYVCGSLNGGKGDSCSVNLTNGRWADFAGDDRDKGGDLISLYAAIKMISMGQAALQLARSEGLEAVAGIVSPAPAGTPPPAPRPPPAPAPKQREKEKWHPTMPVPPYAPKPTFNHFHRKHEDIVHTATYRVDGHVLGYVVRFRTSDGGKETPAYTWCVNESDGSAKWQWKTWSDPRPLFYPGGMHPGGRTVVVVEGEIKAEVLQALLDAGAPGVYCVVSWVGGCKAWQKAMWEWLAGSTVLLWPDCDSKREKLSKAELASLNSGADTSTPEGAAALRDAVVLAASTKPYLPADEQPGKAAMLGIGAVLRDAHGCTVSMLPCEQPGVLPDGWDARDAIEVDGWDFARVLEYFARAELLPAEVVAPVAKKPTRDGASEKKSPPSAEAEPDEGDDAFAELLGFMCLQLGCKRHDLGVTRKLVIAALRKAPELKDCVGFDQLRGAPCTRVAWPWRDAAGPLEESDDLRLGDYLSSKYKLKAASRAALTEAISTVADETRFHPVRDWLDGLEWDKVPRLEKWLIHVLGMDVKKLKPRRRRYLELMGRFLLMGLVARVYEPGCKFDYSPVFEGKGGVGKSTFVKVLVGAEYFSDTHFDIGNGKDGYEQLEGLWGYELSEMTALRRADSEQVKAFFSSTVDRFRGAYGKYVQPHPRQCVIFCTTNKRQYLYDLTGNRRYWPVWINQPILLEWLRKYRAQLFAEAVQAYRRKERYFPTREEEDEFFVPEQMKRMADTSVQSRLWELLTREGATPAEGKSTVELTQHTKFVTLHHLVAVLGADAAKSTAALENQVRGWLEFQGWKYGREGSGQRRWGFKAPKLWPPAVAPDDDEDDEDETERRAQLDGPDQDEVPPAQGSADGGRDDAPF
ncbi:virulence protein E [Variovorax boronicumulans]|uniref:Virulence protein E n=1 Tax=Variovorax boronicumulans TaxID=436515 RepID=A0A250DKS7_9BURK|nr:VapE domain-containing protein [Variovorax boronicumulans]ATA54569.1 virulence protein E [Variovorax boronicumulans]